MRRNRKREVVVVTGASAGVGRAVARAYGRRCASVGLIARGRDGLEEAQREIAASGGRAHIVAADVADSDAVEQAAAEFEQVLGPIGIWVNNAMTSVFSPFLRMTPEEFHRVTEVTYLGVVHGTMSALRRMVPRNRGTIVQVGSALAYRAIPLQSAYCGAKHAVQGFTESVRTELMHDGSRVKLTMVQLPALNTPHFDWVKSRLPRRAQPVPPIYQPEVAARAILWAADHAPREINLGTMTTLTVWGNRLAPALVDWYLARTGYDSQQTDEREDPVRPHNLWQPLPGDYGAHGRFDARASDRTRQLWLATHRGSLFAAGAMFTGAIAALRTRR
jgi:short-subunit dehydrogenase